MSFFNKVILFFFISLGAWQSHAQGDKKKINFKNQLEYGANYTQYFGNRSDLSGMGNAYEKSNTYQHWYLYENFRLFWRDNTYRCYKAIINDKHLVKFSYEMNVSNFLNIGYGQGIWGNFFEMKSLGYGYIFPIKKVHFSLIGQISQRKGGELAIIGSFGSHPYTADLDYNSYGLGLGAECEYFFTKNFSLGANLYYFTFPFEDAKLYGEDVQYVDKSIIDAYKPITNFVNINFRLAYKFSFPSFKKKE